MTIINYKQTSTPYIEHDLDMLFEFLGEIMSREPMWWRPISLFLICPNKRCERFRAAMLLASGCVQNLTLPSIRSSHSVSRVPGRDVLAGNRLLVGIKDSSNLLQS